METEYENAAKEEAGSDALDIVVESSEMKECPEELYQYCYEQVKTEYEYSAETFGEDKSEIYNMFGITEDDIKEEAKDLAKQRLVVEAIAKAENISVSDEDYKNMVASYVENWGCESQEELEESYGVDYIKQDMLQQKVMDCLLSYANISEVQASIYDEE